ncbi:alpha/beta hydrolase [Acinetobacter radioresistens]|uniref:alpha/beta hydrolase n=1 Tax=Acinetobacter radioresistens TaxID=40216 RepID=UPI0022485377|nr:alpha/beta hydrolase [Acinetobacter radioresistens]MCX0333443.1 alpha/beta hydrolase [Acinetobacter radioresistens]
MTSPKTAINYQPDVLGKGYQQLRLHVKPHNSGPVIATLVRKKAAQATRKAVLYIHGFLDYFFQTEMAEQFNQHGFDFYALDLHNYGRSYLPHQELYRVKELEEYDAEITQALVQIQQEQHDMVLLAGHSTGGLISTLYAAHYPEHPLIKALWLNSPFYDFNLSAIEKKFGLPALSQVAKYLPKLRFPSGLNRWYVPSLHQKWYGEWDFDLNWKPQDYPKVELSFIRAIFEAQKEIHQGITIRVPVLVMHSHQTKNPRRWNKTALNSDVILNVRDIKKYAQKIQGKVTIQTIKNGLHDLVLSQKPVRMQVYRQLFDWLDEQEL